MDGDSGDGLVHKNEGVQVKIWCWGAGTRPPDTKGGAADGYCPIVEGSMASGKGEEEEQVGLTEGAILSEDGCAETGVTAGRVGEGSSRSDDVGRACNRINHES